MKTTAIHNAVQIIPLLISDPSFVTIEVLIMAGAVADTSSRGVVEAEPETVPFAGGAGGARDGSAVDIAGDGAGGVIAA